MPAPARPRRVTWRPGFRRGRSGTRLLLVTLSVLLIASACTPVHRSLAPTRTAATDKPNIVYVLTDDLAWNLVRYMPHVLGMQRAGVTLSRFYVVDSLCCPSRTAILTGQYPHNNGVFTNSRSDGGYGSFQRHDDAARTFGPALQRAGYTTGFMGKYLNGYHPENGVPPGWNTWDVAGDGYREFNYRLNENGKIMRYGHRPRDYLTDVLSRKAGSFIDRAAAADKPFLLEVATFAPHRPTTPAPRDAHSFAHVRAPKGVQYGKLPAHAPPWLAKFPPLTRKDTAHIDQAFRQRVRAVQAIDDLIAHVQHTLRAAGVARDTYLVFGSDNGFHMGEYRLRPGKQTAFDTDIRVPLVVTGPGVPAGRTVDALTSGIDLAPTFEQIGGAGISSRCDGVSLLSLWHGRPAPADWQQAILIEHHGPDTVRADPDYPIILGGNPPSYEAIRTAGALYVRYRNGERAYYDTITDPAELDNRAGSVPASTLAPLRRALSALEKCQGATACQAAAQLK